MWDAETSQILSFQKHCELVHKLLLFAFWSTHLQVFAHFLEVLNEKRMQIAGLFIFVSFLLLPPLWFRSLLLSYYSMLLLRFWFGTFTRFAQLSWFHLTSFPFGTMALPWHDHKHLHITLFAHLCQCLANTGNIQKHLVFGGSDMISLWPSDDSARHTVDQFWRWMFGLLLHQIYDFTKSNTSKPSKQLGQSVELIELQRLNHTPHNSHTGHKQII